MFGQLNIPITAWGGTPFTALGMDFTNGLATAAEKSAVQPSAFASMSAYDVSTSLHNLFNAGLSSAGQLDVSTDIAGIAMVLNLDQAFSLKFVPYTPEFQLQRNEDGTYQVTPRQTTAPSTTSDPVAQTSTYGATGTLLSQMTNNAAGGSQIAVFQQPGTITNATFSYSGANGAGTLQAIVANYSNGTSAG